MYQQISRFECACRFSFENDDTRQAGGFPRIDHEIINITIDNIERYRVAANIAVAGHDENRVFPRQHVIESELTVDVGKSAAHNAGSTAFADTLTKTVVYIRQRLSRFGIENPPANFKGWKRATDHDVDVLCFTTFRYFDRFRFFVISN